MNVTFTDLWDAYKAARQAHDRLAERAGNGLAHFAGRRHGLDQFVVDIYLLPVRAAELEAEQLCREASALFDAERAA